MSAQSLVLFTGGNGLDTKVKTLASGAQSATYLSKKEYGAKHDLKGAKLNKAHEAYRVQRGMAGNVSLSAMLTAGQIVAEKVTTKKDGTGFSVGFTYAKELVDDPKIAAAECTTEELTAILKAKGLTDEQLLAAIAKS